MNLSDHVPLGRTGLMVSRMGLASGYGVPAAAIEKAFHEHGINYFFLSVFRRGEMAKALRHLAAGHRDELRIVLPEWPTWGGHFLRRFVLRWLERLNVEQVDLLMLQALGKPPSPRVVERTQALRESGKVRFVGMSSHNRPLFGRMARGEAGASVDLYQIRYNAVHTGAEQDIFPHLPEEKANRPGIVIFTATCWGKLIKSQRLPAGERPLAPADCYRFVLSHPDVDVCLTGPSTAEQMEANLKALDAGPLDEEEMARVRRVGRHIYGK